MQQLHLRRYQHFSEAQLIPHLQHRAAQARHHSFAETAERCRQFDEHYHKVCDSYSFAVNCFFQFRFAFFIFPSICQLNPSLIPGGKNLIATEIKSKNNKCQLTKNRRYVLLLQALFVLVPKFSPFLADSWAWITWWNAMCHRIE